MKLCVLKSTVFMLLWNICGCFSVQYETKADNKKVITRLKRASLLKTNDLPAIGETIAKEMLGMNEAVFSSKEVQDWYKKKIGNKNININDAAQRGQAITLLLSMFCARCKDDCACLRRLECTKPCDSSLQQPNLSVSKISLSLQDRFSNPI